MRLWHALAVILVGAACGGAAAPVPDPLAGVYRIGGGDAALPRVQALADAFTEKHPGVKFTYDTTLGSDGGVNLAGQGALDLGMASRELTASESKTVDGVLIGVIGTGLLVHQSNTVKDLSTDQVQAIFSGRLTDWSAVGLERQLPIIPLVREKGSSARTAFESSIFGGKPTYGATVLEIQGGDQIRQLVVGRPGAIGTIGVTGDDPAVAGAHLVSIDGTMPTKQTLRDGTYKVRRPLYLVYALASIPKPAVIQFLDFIRSPDGQKIIDRF